MLVLLIAALLLTVAGHLWLLDRRDKRDRTERASWLQRTEPAASPLPLSDEEMAEMQAPGSHESVAAIIARMEAAENGTAQIQDGILP